MYFGPELDSEVSRYLKVLFDEEDKTCFAANVFGVEVSDRPAEDSEFLSINPLKGKRKDSNVTKFRNFLIEIDNLDLGQQLRVVLDRVPVSAITYSGGKSYHFIISLDTPVTEAEYKEITKRLHALIPEADRATKNPSRLSRLPKAVRKDTGKLQKIEYLNGRIEVKDLLARLPKVSKFTPKKHQESGGPFLSVALQLAILTPDEAINEYNLSGRNALFFWLGNRLKESGKSYNTMHELISECYSNLSNKTDFSIEEALTAARLK